MRESYHLFLALFYNKFQQFFLRFLLPYNAALMTFHNDFMSELQRHSRIIISVEVTSKMLKILYVFMCFAPQISSKTGSFIATYKQQPTEKSHCYSSVFSIQKNQNKSHRRSQNCTLISNAMSITDYSHDRGKLFCSGAF